MKRNFFVFVLVLLVHTAIAQPVRLYLMGGFSNYSGDLQPSRLTAKEARGAVSAGATFNLTDKLALRGNYSFAKIGADDKKSSNAAFRARNLNFQSIIQEVSLMAEYDLFSLYEKSFTPYAFIGAGLFHASPYTYDTMNRKIYLSGVGTEGQGNSRYPARKSLSRVALMMPIGGGLKWALSNDMQVALELGVRFFNSDYLDDVSRTYVDRNLLLASRGAYVTSLAFRGGELKTNPQPYPAGGTPRGTVKGNDYYYFGQLRINFRLNWFDQDGGRGANSGSRGLGCPKRF